MNAGNSGTNPAARAFVVSSSLDRSITTDQLSKSESMAWASVGNRVYLSHSSHSGGVLSLYEMQERCSNKTQAFQSTKNTQQ